MQFDKRGVYGSMGLNFGMRSKKLKIPTLNCREEKERIKKQCSDSECMYIIGGFDHTN